MYEFFTLARGDTFSETRKFLGVFVSTSKYILLLSLQIEDARGGEKTKIKEILRTQNVRSHVIKPKKNWKEWRKYECVRKVGRTTEKNVTGGALVLCYFIRDESICIFTHVELKSYGFISVLPYMSSPKHS